MDRIRLRSRYRKAEDLPAGVACKMAIGLSSMGIRSRTHLHMPTSAAVTSMVLSLQPDHCGAPPRTSQRGILPSWISNREVRQSHIHVWPERLCDFKIPMNGGSTGYVRTWLIRTTINWEIRVISVLYGKKITHADKSGHYWFFTGDPIAVNKNTATYEMSNRCLGYTANKLSFNSFHSF